MAKENNPTPSSLKSTASKPSRRHALKLGAAAYIAAVAPARAQTTKQYDAVIIGAGLSGLHAAMLLEEQGLNVLTLEGRNRLGGRVYTLMGVPGQPEAAGELIGSSYARMIDTARRLDLELVEPDSLASSSGGRYFHIKGQNITAEEWPEHPLNPMTGEDREILPNRMLFELSLRNNPLLGQPLDAWLKPEFQKFDIPQSEFLKKYAGFNDETIRLMDVVVHTDHMETTSALHECRRYAVGQFFQTPPGEPWALQVKGGNSLMPEAMANSLTNGVLLNKTVYALEDTGGEVTVHCGDGTKYRAKQVVCSMPYPVLRNVRFDPILPPRMARAVEEIDYGISIQIHYAIKKNFWEEDGLPTSMWSDAPFERFGVLNRGENGEASSAIAFINGKEAYKYNFMSDAQVADYTTRELIKIRPSIEGALEPILVQSCHRNVHGAGDWVFWRPGQVTEFASHMREPHGNIHFCGEHTAIMQRGMEGAFESGERAAFDALMRI